MNDKKSEERVVVVVAGWAQAQEPSVSVSPGQVFSQPEF
jgi:hypothetical protein